MTESFNSLIEELRNVAQELLREGQVDMFIGFGPGTLTTRTTPLFISEPDAAAKLTWSPFCANNLAAYLLDYRETTETIGVLMKGCDSRSVIRLLQDNQFPRERLVVTGIPCAGILDAEKVAPVLYPLAVVTDVKDQGDSFLLVTATEQHRFAKKDYLLPKCLECIDSGPVIYDRFLGPRPTDQEGGRKRFEEIESLEKLSPLERSEYWDQHFQNCLRCYACRNVCPACNCRECIFDQAGPDWISKRNNLSENTAFHVIRALHVAGRCVDCGECDRVCPVNIPLRLLNQKVLKDIDELFDAPMPGTDLEQQPVLGHYCADDPDEFK